MTAHLLLPATAGRRPYAIVAWGIAAAFVLLAGALIAQVGGDRGIAPVASSSDIEVSGIEVNVLGTDAEDARQKGWQEAYRKAWEKIDGPAIPDGQLASLVTAIVIESERLGPRRYIATLGVVFDRTRAGGLLGTGDGERSRSAPMLTLPVMISGGTATMYETRGPWQRAWAEYQAGASSIDYVRPSGAGGESLLLTYGQVARRSRAWWNTILDQFGAADIIVPVARIERQWPGGPVRGTFTARYGPDDRFLGRFTLTAANEQGVPAMLAHAVKRFDALFTRALEKGLLRPDPTLSRENVVISPEIQALIDAAQRAERAAANPEPAPAATAAPDQPAAPATPAPISVHVVQVATPDAAAFDAALGALRGVPGVRAAVMSSAAIGGTSVARVSYEGDLAALAAGLRARGYTVQTVGTALSIRR